MGAATRETTRAVYDVQAIDGEGISCADGSHLYTLLLAYDSRYQKTRYIENWEEGLDTDRVLDFLLHLPRGKRTICAAYFFNYDVTMWLKDLSEQQKTALWRSGWVVYEGPRSKQLYYIRYIPTKIFFVGEYSLALGNSPSMFDWRKYHLASTTIYDTSGFAQRAFIKALEEWDISSGVIGEMKAERSSFTAAQRSEIIDYCEDECEALADWIQKQDETFLQEGIDLHSWHGGGALASYFLRQHAIDRQICDPEIPEIQDAIMRAYFGGRSQVFTMGHIPGPVYDYDLNSAYPAMACYLPDLVQGHWEYVRGSAYNPQLPYALWHVVWGKNQLKNTIYHLPYRYQHGVYYPCAGDGWYHAHEVNAVAAHQDLLILEGWQYVPETNARPFAFLRDYAQRRVAYKEANDPRAIPYKYGLNSIYGKLAQHDVDEHTIARFQSYYAAGFITSMARAMLVHFMYSNGGDASDVLMLATDGVFCLEPRTHFLGADLGHFKFVGTLDEMVLVQPGCWYTPGGESRTRGFSKKSLTYDRVLEEWNANGVHGRVTYEETRFVGLGSCVGTGNFAEYGRWIQYVDKPESQLGVNEHEARQLFFMPNHMQPGADLLRGAPYGTLTAMDMGTMGTSQLYVPPRLQDPQPAVENLEWIRGQIEMLEQPDMAE